VDSGYCSSWRKQFRAIRKVTCCVDSPVQRRMCEKQYVLGPRGSTQENEKGVGWIPREGLVESFGLPSIRKI